MIEHNIWHKAIELKNFIDEVLKRIRGGEIGWTWIKNSDCKYIDIRIDMRDGGWILLNRGGKRILPEDFYKQ